MARAPAAFSSRRPSSSQLPRPASKPPWSVPRPLWQRFSSQPSPLGSIGRRYAAKQQAFSFRAADRDRERVSPPRHHVGREERRCGASRSGVWRDRSPALMAQVGFFVHQIAFLEPAIGRTQAGLTVALLTAMAIVGRLALGVSLLRLDLRRVTALSLLSQAAALLAMTQT